MKNITNFTLRYSCKRMDAKTRNNELSKTHAMRRKDYLRALYDFRLKR